MRQTSAQIRSALLRARCELGYWRDRLGACEAWLAKGVNPQSCGSDGMTLEMRRRRAAIKVEWYTTRIALLERKLEITSPCEP